MVKPIKIFLFITLILLLLLTGAWIVPSDGFKIRNFTLRYPGIASIQEKLVGSIIRQKGKVTPVKPGSTTANIQQQPDSTFTKPAELDYTNEQKEQSVPVNINLLKEKNIPIEFADSSHSAITGFFNALKTGKALAGQVRVIHFGDSQIEGDRITMYIRGALQERFGGNGIGIIPGYPQSYQPLNVKHSVSGDWQYSSLLDGGGEVNRYGLLGGITQIADGTNADKIELKKVGKPARNNWFKRVRVFFGQNDSTYLLQLKVNDGITNTQALTKTSTVAERTFTVPPEAKNIELLFSGNGPLTVYGVSLESGKGIYVDNIPQRGSSGAVFTKFDANFSRKIFNMLNVELVILQYGVNVVPANLSNYSYYEDILYRQIKAIKSFKPDVSVLLIGVSDMSQKSDDKFESYPSIEKVRDAQRSAAFRAGAAFWDCYKAMGGQNSMPEWVYASPPLATKDFTHFNYKGSKVIAEMFMASLLDEYTKFINAPEQGNGNPHPAAKSAEKPRE